MSQEVSFRPISNARAYVAQATTILEERFEDWTYRLHKLNHSVWSKEAWEELQKIEDEFQEFIGVQE